MKPEYKLSGFTLEKLTQHLVEVKANRGKIIDEFFPEVTKERHEFESLMELYTHEIDNFIKNVKPSKSEESSLPFVIMGSEVEVLDTETAVNLHLRL